MTECIEICVHVMPVLAEKCSVLSLHELFDLRCEVVVLPQSQSIANVMHFTVPVQPLPCAKLIKLLINLIPHILMNPRGLYQRNMGLIAVMSDYGS